MRLLEQNYDPVTGITEQYWSWTDSAGKQKLTIRRLQDVETNLNFNKAQYNMHDGVKYGDSNGVHKVASIPLVIVEKWLREEGFNWYQSSDKERRAMLNRPENRYLLVRPGKL